MEKLRTALNRVLELLAGLSMSVMVILTTYQVIVRYIFSSPSTWSEELVGSSDPPAREYSCGRARRR